MIVVSNGFDRFPLATAAALVAKAGLLNLLITGGYPTPRAKRVMRRLGLSGVKAGRLLRREEDVPADKLRALWLPEALYAARVAGGPLKDRMNVGSMRAYGRAAGRLLPQAVRDGARIYHYRAGYGGRSVEIARRLGMITLCDHSIAHPALVEGLTEAHGRLDLVDRNRVLTPFEQVIRDDIDAADHVLVNSGFVKETFLPLGYDAARIHVIYMGIDNGFLRMVPPERPAPDGPLRLLAPALTPRKGAATLVEAMRGLGDVDWRLTISRTEPGMERLYADFLSDPRVTRVEPERPELARLMRQHEAVVFPTYAEGSARVVFEALAAGLYVITTPNAGSVVADGVHGRIVPPGDAEAVRAAIREAAADRIGLARIGAANAAWVPVAYGQDHYGQQLLALYDRLLNR